MKVYEARIVCALKCGYDRAFTALVQNKKLFLERLKWAKDVEAVDKEHEHETVTEVRINVS